MTTKHQQEPAGKRVAKGARHAKSANRSRGPALRYGYPPAEVVYARRRRRHRRHIAEGVLLLVAFACALAVGARALVQPGSTPQGPQLLPSAPQSQQGSAQAGAGSSAEPQAEPVQVRLVMVGDILKHMPLVESGYREDGTYNYDHIYAHVGEELAGFDLRVVNQETPTAGADFGYSGYPSFNAPLAFNDAIAKAGFNVVLKASNHTMDMGYEGIHAELAYWGQTYPGVRTIGCVDPTADAAASPYAPYVYEKDGFRVALLNFTYDLNGYEDPQGAVALLDQAHEQDVRAAIRAARQQADMVVVFPHWGVEYELQPSDEQRAWAQVFAEEGVDVVIGGHPHVIEPVEVLARPDGSGMLCFWSVGNFVSNQPNSPSLVGGMAEVTLTKAADGTCSVGDYAFVPVVCHKGLGADFTTYLLRDYTDELAATNVGVWTDSTDCTPAWVDGFCQEVLGGGYDPELDSLSGTLAEADPVPILPVEDPEPEAVEAEMSEARTAMPESASDESNSLDLAA